MIRALTWLLWLLAVSFPAAVGAEPAVSPRDWAAYKQRFLDESGRIVDDANANISHSEGQGYGMLLAYFADARPDFDLIWSFTRKELVVRDDQLAVWKWNPDDQPHVKDVNNASDGDVLIAYALALAGRGWHDQAMLDAASEMIRAIGKAVVVDSGGRIILLPGASGFSAAERPDGPVVNLSYWVFEAFPIFAELDPSTPWARLSDDGLALIAQARFGPRRLPPDWLSLGTIPRPAKGFPAEFGYNAIRIPLYMVRAGVDLQMARDIAGAMTFDGAPGTADLEDGRMLSKLQDPGYAIIPALASCATGDAAVPPALLSFTPTLYYPSTLHLLVLAHLAGNDGRCR